MAPPVHKSGVWLQILGLTAGMHSCTPEAAITAKTWGLVHLRFGRHPQGTGV